MLTFQMLPKSSLGCCPTAIPCPQEAKVQKETKNMRYENIEINPSITIDTEGRADEFKRAHLRNRVYTLHYNHDAALTKAFNLYDDKDPSSPKELAERLQKGLYVIDNPEVDKNFGWGNWMGVFHWRDPAKPADREGYEAASKNLEAATQKLQDDIAILDPKEALASVREFEQATFH